MAIKGLRVLGFSLFALLASCYNRDMAESVGDQIKSDLNDADDSLDRARVPGRPINKDIISVSDDVWLGDSALVAEHNDPIPRKFEGEEGITVMTDGPMEFNEITNQIQYLTSIPTQVEETLLAAGGESGGLPSLAIAYTGSLSGLLDVLAMKVNGNWSYENGKILFYKFKTRTFVLHTLATDSTFNVGVDSSAGAGSTASLVTTSTLKEWTEIEAVIRSIVKDGDVTVSPSTNSITVSSTPKVLAKVESYIKEQNRRFAKQVAVTVRVLQVTMNKSNSYGLNLTSVFRTVSEEGAESSVNVISNSSSVAAGGVSFSILSGGGTNSSRTIDGAFRALSTQGKTSLVTSAVVTARNNRVVPINNIQTFKYISSISTLTESTASTTEIVPAEESVGFSMQIMPNILENGRLMLLFNMSLKELVELSSVNAGGTTIQLPKIEQRNFMQELVMESGQTAVLTGFEKIENNNRSDGLGQMEFTWIGGSQQTQASRSVLVVMLTPQIITSPLEVEENTSSSEWDMPTY